MNSSEKTPFNTVLSLVTSPCASAIGLKARAEVQPVSDAGTKSFWRSRPSGDDKSNNHLISCALIDAALVASLLFVANVANGQSSPKTIHVPADYPTIQAAIIAASTLTNDTVLVSPGVYNEAVNFNGRPAALISANGSATTVINPTNGSSAITFGSGETSNSIVFGFTITNGGISVSHSSPTIISNKIVSAGTGISSYFGSPNVLSNIITGGTGSGIDLSGACTAVIRGNTIQNNGGGISMNGSGSPLVVGNVIQGNHGNGIGMMNDSDPDIVQNVIVNNNGNGVSASVPGYIRGPFIMWNTIVGNGASGIWETGFYSSSQIMNNIVIGSPAITMDPSYGQPPGIIEFNDFYSTNGNAFVGDSITNLTGTNGNISVDPWFACQRGGDYHLLPGSLGIDAGTNGALDLPPSDFDGNARVLAGHGNGPAIVDLGAYEFDPASPPNPCLYISCPSNVVVATAVGQTSVVVNYPPPDASPGATVTCLPPSGSVFPAGTNVVVCTLVYGTNVLTCTFIVTVRATIDTSGTGVYVNVNNTNPMAPYTNWIAAATNIQDAIDAASPGSLILVTNGLYRSGSLTIAGTTNRVVVTKALRIQSVNGAAVTTIDGAKQMRCVYLTNGAVLGGFTLTNGSAGNGAGVLGASTNAFVLNCVLTTNSANNGGGGYSCTLSNCSLSGNVCLGTGGTGGGAFGCLLINCTLNGNSTGTPYPNTSGGSVGGGAYNCSLNNCLISGNTANGAGASGGGSYSCSLNGCTLSGNSATYGGGAYACTLTNCTITNNGTGYSGGGVTGCTLQNCTVSRNTSGFDGGAESSTLNNCTLTGNSAGYGGGTGGCTLNNCLIYNNQASAYGGGTYGGTLNNCTVVGNSSSGGSGGYGSGSYNGTLNNSIVLNNTGGPELYGCTLNYSCALTATGAGNITNAPLLDASFHLQSGSPCIDAGNNAYVTTSSDLAGNLRVANGKVDMGAYEFQTAGPLTVAIQASLTNVPVQYTVNFTGSFSKGKSDSWNFGDGTVISNQLSASHSWAAAGDYPVVLTAYDSSNPGGVSASVTIRVNAHMMYYVNPASTNPVAPYDTWSTAATNIQDAIDVAMPVPQSLVLATNGTYNVGGRIVYGSMTNRVTINKTITVQSLNGPAVTVIQGNPAIGDTAVRCVYLTNNAILSGFTITGGATRSTGDATHENSGGGVWCESSSAVVSNCVLTGNSAVVEGGGIYGGTLKNSTVSSNNTAFTIVSGNGGGASASILNGCILFNNLAGAAGGGVNNSTLTGCALTGNHANINGGGVNSSTLSNCTLIENSSWTGGGANSCTLNNCIAYYNTAFRGANYSGGTLNYCCTQPLPESGDGNTATEPRLPDSSHISADSPCRAAGSTNYLSGADIDGEAWSSPPSIGCDEFYGGVVTGALTVGMQLSYTNAAPGFIINCAGTILGHASTNVWNFGDGTKVTNRISVSHEWASDGLYQVVLTAYNGGNSAGVSTTGAVHVVTKPLQYVSSGSISPVSPYLSWATAATNIQDAVDSAFGGGTILVSNGVYQTGGRIVYGSLTNRLVINKAVTVQSVNGPTATAIQGNPVVGDSAVRCVYLADGAALVGFTITNGATRAPFRDFEDSGGGLWCESTNSLISDCTIAGNSTEYFASAAYGGTLRNCLLSGNSTGQGTAYGSTLSHCVISNNNGGSSIAAMYCLLDDCLIARNRGMYGILVYSSTLNNCTIANNWDGVYYSVLTNCVIYSNTTANYDANSTLSFCCSVPLASGLGNFTNNPNFIDSVGGNFRLQTNSPCINSGNNSYVSSATDLDGRARIVEGTVDMGAYEFQGVGAGEFIAWLQQNGLPTDGSADSIDSDGDGLNNWQEWVAGTSPTNPLTRLVMLNPTFGGSAVNVTWQSVSNRTYFIQRSTNISAHPAFMTLASNIAGQSGTTTYPDTSTVGPGPFLYRVGVEGPLPFWQQSFSSISFAWLQHYGLPTDGSADFIDTDHDAMNNWREWIAGTDPTTPSSVLKILAASNSLSGISIKWQSVTNRTYFLNRSTNLSAQPSFSVIQSNISGQAGTTTFTDANATNSGPYFYRVGVQQ